MSASAAILLQAELDRFGELALALAGSYDPDAGRLGPDLAGEPRAWNAFVGLNAGPGGAVPPPPTAGPYELCRLTVRREVALLPAFGKLCRLVGETAVRDGGTKCRHQMLVVGQVVP